MVEVRRCIFSLPWESESRSHLLVSQVRRRCRPGGATRPFFTCLSTYYLISPGADAPPLPAGLSALTSRPNPQNSPPSASMPPLPSSLSAPFSPPSIHLGPGRWWMAPQERVAGRVRSAFWNFFSEMARDELRRDWHGFDEREKWRENMLGGQRKRRRKHKKRNCQSVQTIPPRCCACSPRLLLLSLFITCVFPSPILPVLSAVSKADWGLLCILVHVGMVARVCSLSICLGCQGVSWVPARLLLNIYHLFNAIAPPRELDSASNASLLFPTPSFPFSTHTYRRCFFMLFRRALSMLYFLAYSVSAILSLREPKHVRFYTCGAEPTPERPGASQPSAGNSQIYRGLPLTSSRDRR